MTDLADRIEALSGPCRETDGEIAAAVGMKHGPDHGWLNNENGDYWTVDECAPMFTASIDAAMSLVPEGYAAAVGTMFGAPQKPWACVWTPQGEPKYRAEASTPALALCAAAIRARGE